ncbi:hypothetical protein [Tsukamurella sp. NPDC003166]|uniref:hypothetical protein n=1 Tax=Tsukamurella sp. NPDC003166 TaxID=3154444 RepID=UPI0033A5DFDC
MTAVESRLAATLAKHPLYADEERDVCNCGWEPDYEVVDFTAGAAIPAHEHVTMQHSAHQAAVIASSDDLAVISLPEPQTEDDEGETVTFWPFSDSTTVRTYPRYGEVGWSVHGEPEEPVTPAWTQEFAAALLAAAKAAEAVSDR